MLLFSHETSILDLACRRLGWDAERERAAIRRREREDALRCRASVNNRYHLDPLDQLVREFRAFRRELPDLLALVMEDRL